MNILHEYIGVEFTVKVKRLSTGVLRKDLSSSNKFGPKVS